MNQSSPLPKAPADTLDCDFLIKLDGNLADREAHGRLMLTILGGLAEFERDLISARTGVRLPECLASPCRKRCLWPPTRSSINVSLLHLLRSAIVQVFGRR
jgi:hypothetical protein